MEDIIVYNVMELNQLIGRDIKHSFPSISDIDLTEALQFWYGYKLYKMNSVLFRHCPTLTFKGSKYLKHFIMNYIHPAYESLLYRFVKIPPIHYHRHVYKLTINEVELFLYFEKGSFACM